MRKLILACAVTFGFVAPLAAQAATLNPPAPSATAEMTVVAAPAPELQHLQNQMQSIQIQVQALQTRQQASDAYNLAELENLPAT